MLERVLAWQQVLERVLEQVLERVLEEQWRHRSQGLQLQASRSCCASIRQQSFSTLHRRSFSSFGSLVHRR